MTGCPHVRRVSRPDFNRAPSTGPERATTPSGSPGSRECQLTVTLQTYHPRCAAQVSWRVGRSKDRGPILRVEPVIRRRRKVAGGGCRPDSVPRRATSIHLGRALPHGSSNLPGDLVHRSGVRGQASLGPPIRSCSAWGLPCPLRLRRGGALLPHPFTLTPGRPGGGLLSAALSLALPRPGVTRHAACQESGLSSTRKFEQRTPASFSPDIL